MSTVRVAVTLLACLIPVSGCAGGSSDPRKPVQPTLNLPASPSPAASRAPVGASSLVPTGRLIVHFQRVTGYDPWAAEVSVNTRGQAVAIETDGGRDGQKRKTFTLPPTALRHLQRLIRRTHLHDTWCCSARSYTYLLYIDNHAWRLQQGHVPASMAPLIADLNAITSAHTIWNS
jgi:hypothetical protein